VVGCRRAFGCAVIAPTRHLTKNVTLVASVAFAAVQHDSWAQPLDESIIVLSYQAFPSDFASCAQTGFSRNASVLVEKVRNTFAPGCVFITKDNQENIVNVSTLRSIPAESDPASCWSVILSENRLQRFGIMF
jgi:hypothetical protein